MLTDESVLLRDISTQEDTMKKLVMEIVSQYLLFGTMLLHHYFQIKTYKIIGILKTEVKRKDRIEEKDKKWLGPTFGKK